MYSITCMQISSKILICLDCGPWTTVGPHKGFKVWCWFLYRCNNCLRSSWELQCVICDMLFTFFCKKGLNVKHKYIWVKIWNYFYTESILLLYPVILYIVYDSIYFTLAIVDRVSDVATHFAKSWICVLCVLFSYDNELEVI